MFFLYFIPGGLLSLIFGSVLISGALRLSFIPKELVKVFKKLIQENFTKNIP